MTAVPLGALPAITYLLLAYVVRPAGGAIAPVRLALTRAAVLVGAAVAVLVEVLSAVHALTVAAAVIAWSVGLVAAGVGVVLRYRRDRRAGSAVGIGALVARARCAWAATGRVERILLIVLAVQIAAELVIAVVSPPNNYDSQTYHLPKIEHWVVQRDVSFYPTSIDRQLSMAPGAEYLLLQLRLLTGGDALYNLLQLAAGLGCALLAARIAGQLGGSVRAQLLTAFVVGTTPMVALESTSTQTDLVVAAWVAALATLVLDELDRRTPLGSLALLGTGTGLVVLTKATGAVAAGPLLLYWLVVQARRGVPRALAAGALTVALALVVAGPFLQRSYAEYGNPLGPPIQRDAISMQRHDPPAILVNTLRIAQNVLQTPSTRLNNGAAREIERLSRAMGVNPDDRSITFWGSTFPAATWLPDEDKAAFPVEALLVLGGAVVLLTTRRPATVRWYAALFWVSLLGYVATVKWQPWGNRLILFLLVLGAPLAGLWLDALARARWRGRRVPAVAVTVALVLS
ncbi:MAG TPA: glycosyltransferase family 39 protein, partial [Rugosimonospora sp.]|nr:glycosyltransferase family 39 protein [Rugosimonospora sp.]